MIICPEIKKISGALRKIEKLSAALAGKIDTNELDFKNCYLVNGCQEANGHLYKRSYRLDNLGMVDNTYYCYQFDVGCEDNYHGILYFKTNVPGQFVAVSFEQQKGTE